MQNTATAIEVISAKLDNGTELPLRSQQSKTGNTYWAALARKKDGTRYFSRYGTPVAANVIGGALPKIGSSITILSTKLTFGQKVDKVTKEVKPGSVEATGTITVPGHGKKQVQVLITEKGEGTYNLLACIRGAGTGGGAHPLDEL